MKNLKRGALLLLSALMIMVLGTAGSFAADQGLHVTSASALHRTVQQASGKAADARRQVADLIDGRSFVLPANASGLTRAELKSRIASLTDSEILDLQRQLMPKGEQDRPAGLEEKYMIPILSGISAGLAIGMFMFAY